MIYLTGWFVLYVTLVLYIYDRKLGKYFPIISIMTMGLIAVLRGDIGTDTYQYEMMVNYVRQEYIGRIEIGFVLLLSVLSMFFESDVIVVRAVSLIIAAIFVVYYLRGDREERFFLLSYIIPVFFYKYTMNTLRIGLASALLLLAIQMARRGRVKSFYTAGLSALFFHYTSLLSFFVVAIFESLNKPITYKRLMVYVGTVALIVLIVTPELNSEVSYVDRFEDKQTPSELSGLSQVLLIIILLIGVFYSKQPQSFKTNLILIGFLFAAVGWWMSRLSYAGLRFLDLVTFFLPLCIMLSLKNYGGVLDCRMKLAILLAGFVGAIAQFRRVVSTDDSIGSPWLPYVTLF